MDLQLKNRRALVIAGTRGLGRGAADALAAEGTQLVITGRDVEAGAAAANELGANTTFIAGNIRDENHRARLIDEAEAALNGPIDILVTNAGGPPTGQFSEQPLDAWREAIETNMLSVVDLARRVVPGMAERGFGRIVNITSFAVKEPYPNMALSNGVRTGMTGAMATLAREVIHQGVTVNSVLPGLMDTGALERVYKARARRDDITPEAAKASLAASVPAGRLGTAEEFGPICAFLCSPLAGYITAQNIAVDGGLIRGLL